MKFSEVKIGARFIDKKFAKPKPIVKTPLFLVTELIDGEIDDIKTNAVSVDGVYFFYKDESEVELISKCYNCKHFDSHIKFCNMLGMGIELGDDESLDQDPETFSCSLFELKPE